MDIIEVVRVRFLWPGKMYEFSNPEKLPLKRGQEVVVQNDHGGSLVGKVMIAPRIRMARKEDKSLNPVLRLATEQDKQFASTTDDFKLDVKNFFETRLRARNLNGVKLIDLEKADQGQRLIVYYSSEQRKFSARELAVEMGQKFNLKIDLRSVGVRDAARLSGGIGKCGLSLCCSTWIPDFAQISIRMAKDQGMSLDPDSINGMCGRLLCCLGYEHDNYVELGKGLPKIGKKVVTPIGDARVVKLDILKGLVTVKSEDGKYETYPGDVVSRKFGPGGATENSDDSSEEATDTKPRTSSSREKSDRPNKDSRPRSSARSSDQNSPDSPPPRDLLARAESSAKGADRAKSAAPNSENPSPEKPVGEGSENKRPKKRRRNRNRKRNPNASGTKPPAKDS